MRNKTAKNKVRLSSQIYCPRTFERAVRVNLSSPSDVALKTLLPVAIGIMVYFGTGSLVGGLSAAATAFLLLEGLV